MTPEQLETVLTYHVVSGAVFSDNLSSGAVGTIEGNKVDVQVKRNGEIKVNNASVISADVEANNGVIHIIGQVILPPGLYISSP